jgi:DNA adenine methylase
MGLIKTKSIFRYPGGKTRMSDIISEYFKDYDTIISPFLGGGSVELKLGDLGKKVITSDIDEHLINCWQRLCNDRDEMYGYAECYYKFFHSDVLKEIKREKYIKMREEAGKLLDVCGAAKYWIVNRLSFSGLGLRGGFSEQAIKAELGPLVMKRLKEWNRPKGFEIPVRVSFEELLNKYPDFPVFLDPPYYLKKGWLYPNHKDFDHKKLVDILKKRNTPFMMTYNDCPEIRELYSYENITIRDRAWYYAMSNSRQGKELFITHKISGIN